MPDTLKLILITAASLAIWAVAVRVLARLTRPRMPRAAPATPELRDDSPAVVNLLVNRGRPNEDAARATLLDLAARRIIEISQPGDDPLRPVVQIREREPQGLNAYERRVFDRLVRAAPDGALAVWRLARNLYVSLRAIADLVAPVTVTGTLLSLRDSGPNAEQKAQALNRYPAGMGRWHRAHEGIWMRAVVDDGRSDRLRPWHVSMRDVEGVEAGQIVTVTGQRFGRHARWISRVATVSGTTGRLGRSGERDGQVPASGGVAE